MQPNLLQAFYPKQVQKHLNRRKNQNTDRIVNGLQYNHLQQQQSNGKFNQLSGLKLKLQKSSNIDVYNMNKGITLKHLKKMKTLSKCQAKFIQLVLQKIDRRSKPIKKQERWLSKSLQSKKIFLEEENWDILSLKKDEFHLKLDQSERALDVKKNQSESIKIPNIPQQQFTHSQDKLNLKSEKDKKNMINDKIR